jgi:hypothetical protein
VMFNFASVLQPLRPTLSHLTHSLNTAGSFVWPRLECHVSVESIWGGYNTKVVKSVRRYTEHVIRSQCSSVDIVTRLRAARPVCSILDRGWDFSLCHRVQTTWVPRACFAEVKHPGREVEHSSPSSAKFKTVWNYTSTHHRPSCRGTYLSTETTWPFISHLSLHCRLTVSKLTSSILNLEFA